ncbi:MAG: M17 family metallopeptidase [Rubrimonas sp.]
MRSLLDSADAPATPLHLVEPADMAAMREALDPAAWRWIAAQGFSGALGDVACAPDAAGAPAVALIGWGDAAARARGRFHLAAAVARLPEGVYRIETELSADAKDEAALGWALSAYRFARRGETASPSGAERRLVVADPARRARAADIAEAVAMGRDLVNAPANELGPAELDAAARALAARFGATVETVEGEALLSANLPLIHAVGRAGAQAPRLIDLRWGRADAPSVSLVGKGVCFDTGGLDLKPASNMRLMKKDMGGAAAALALAQMIMARRLDLRLRVLIPAVENAVSALSFRPGDILPSRKGLTVEISNTDAEGRLVLADALALACEERPGLLIDFATLTGAARVALGPDLPALFTDDEALAAELLAAGAKARDPLWRLPLWPPYEAEVASPVADLDNAPEGGFAGAITAALFLKRFAEGAPSWAHVDLFAWTPKPLPGRPKGGEVQAARAVFAALEARHG